VNNTTALCNECYREIPAVANPFAEGSRCDVVPMIYKLCSEHGLQRGQLEADYEFYDKFNSYDRINYYTVLIINVTDACNIKCKHCYYPVKNKWNMPLDQFKNLITVWKGRFKQFIISGGDPTVWEHYEEAGKWCKEQKVFLSQLTNGVRFADPLFWETTKTAYGFMQDGEKYLGAEMSIHPANISPPGVRETQIRVLERMRAEGIKQSCIMMNVDTSGYKSLETSHHALQEVLADCVRFIVEWKDVTAAFRIRTVCFDAWGATTPGSKWYLSDLVKNLYTVCNLMGVEIHYSFQKDVDNIYNQNFVINGSQVVTVCAANIRSLDLGYLNRGPFMLANDGKPYSVPHAIVINEGIDKGFYGGCKC